MTAEVAERILVAEREAARRFLAGLDRAAEASLHAVGVLRWSQPSGPHPPVTRPGSE